MRTRVRNFFFPPAEVSRLRRVLPYAVLGMLTLILLMAGVYGWEYTNSPIFCGSTCHTMPPEFAAYQISPHARVYCVDCHIGRGFIATRITRKAGDIQHVTDTLFKNYEYPIFAGRLRPARETCEKCHYPAKFSDDSLRQNIHYRNDEENSSYSVFLAMHTGGGTQREGLGRGIHWHVENEVYFVATDDLQQEIPYVRVVGPDGKEDVYVALDSPLSAKELAGMEQERMDCITCHNRITHNILPPEQAVDMALARKQINADIPYIRSVAVDLLSQEYDSDEAAESSIRRLGEHYTEEYPDYYAEHKDDIEKVTEMLLAIYTDSNFRDQEVNWETHPNNLGHRQWPGCFRCHDGQHISQDDQAIRLECNLCHSIPQVVEAGVIEPSLPLTTGIQPESHFSTHWIALHRNAIDQSCQACHSVENPGGTDNSSFCSNSACHGTTWTFAGLDAPELAKVLEQEKPPTPTPTPTAEIEEGEDITFSNKVGALFQERCTACHSKAVATGGLVLESYNAAMTGGGSGPVIIPGDAEASLMVKIQREVHFANFTDEELQIIIDWINSGAPN